MASRTGGYEDLALVVFLVGIESAVVGLGVTGSLRVALVLPLVTFLPGYALFALLYPGAGTPARRTFDENEHSLGTPLPGKTGIDNVERLALSAVASPVVVASVALVSSFTPWGVTLVPILGGVTGLTVLCALGALVRRARFDPSRRYAPTLAGVVSGLTRSWSRHGPDSAVGSRERRPLFSLGLAFGLLLLAGSVGFALVTPPQGDAATEFYVDTEDVTGDTQSMYPSQFDTGESRPLPLVVTSHDGTSTDYSVVVLLQRVQGADEQVVAQERLATESFTLAAGETQRLSPAIEPTMSGSDLRLAVLLYRGDPPTDPSTDDAYRALRLPVEVGSGGS